ncbi:hypothetical protein ACP70R_001714 [Stipagrostis hirtigluma subsp. patula]
MQGGRTLGGGSLPSWPSPPPNTRDGWERGEPVDGARAAWILGERPARVGAEPISVKGTDGSGHTQVLEAPFNPPGDFLLLVLVLFVRGKKEGTSVGAFATALLRLARTRRGGAVGIVSPSSLPAATTANRISGTMAFEPCLASVTELFGRFAL